MPPYASGLGKRKRNTQSSGKYVKKRKFNPKRGKGKYVLKRTNNKKFKRKSSRNAAAVRKIVKAVIHKEEPLGTYTKTWNAYLEEPPSNAQIVTQEAWQNGAQRAGCDFRFFSRARLLDAVSVLFNNKTKDINYSTTTDNFTTTGLKFNVKYASAQVEIINYSDTVVEYTAVKLEPKNDTDSNARDTFVNALTTIEQPGPGVSVSHYSVLPGQLPQMNHQYSMKKQKFLLKPGQRVKFFFSAKPGHCDFGQNFGTGSTPLQYLKRWSQELMLIYRPDIVVGYDLGTGTKEVVGHYVGGTGPLNGIVVQVKEVYKINAPENTSDAEDNDQYAWYHDLVAHDPGHNVRQVIPYAPSYLGVNV